MVELKIRILNDYLLIILFSIFWISITFTLEIKYLFNKKIVKTNIKKYNRIPCQVFIRSNLPTRNSFFSFLKVSFLKVSLSLISNFTNVFFFNTKHSSNLISMDLKKGYFGLVSLSLFSIEFIICSEIFEIRDNS